MKDCSCFVYFIWLYKFVVCALLGALHGRPSAQGFVNDGGLPQFPHRSAALVSANCVDQQPPFPPFPRPLGAMAPERWLLTGAKSDGRGRHVCDFFVGCLCAICMKSRSQLFSNNAGPHCANENGCSVPSFPLDEVCVTILMSVHVFFAPAGSSILSPPIIVGVCHCGVRSG